MVDSIKEVRVDTRPPRVSIASVEPNVIVPGGLARGAHPLPRPAQQGARVPGVPHRRRRARARRGCSAATRAAPASGTAPSAAAASRPRASYSFNVKVRDLAGNKTEAPGGRSPSSATRRRARASPCARSRFRARSAWCPPARSRCCAWARASAASSSRSRAWGRGRTIRKDRRRGGRLRVRIPSDARTGIYLVRVRLAGGRRAVWPLAVAGLPPRGTRGRPRPIVVLPAVTWQGTNEFDSDLDGFADTLDEVNAVPAERPFAAAAPCRRASAPRSRRCCEFLDRERLPYDLTTDLSLARREGPAIGNAPGVAIAGTADVAAAPRARPAAGGGRRSAAWRWRPSGASRCAGRWRWTAACCATPARPARTTSSASAPASSAPTRPRRCARSRTSWACSPAWTQLFGEFSVFERSDRLPPDARAAHLGGPRGGRAGVRGLPPRQGHRDPARARRSGRRQLEEIALGRGGAARHAQDLAVALQARADRVPILRAVIALSPDRRAGRPGARGRGRRGLQGAVRRGPAREARLRHGGVRWPTDTPETPAAAGAQGDRRAVADVRLRQPAHQGLALRAPRRRTGAPGGWTRTTRWSSRPSPRTATSTWPSRRACSSPRRQDRQARLQDEELQALRGLVADARQRHDLPGLHGLRGVRRRATRTPPGS